MLNGSFIWSYSEHENTILVSGWVMKSWCHLISNIKKGLVVLLIMVSKVQGLISFLLLIFLKSESSIVEGTGDERHVHAPQTRWRWSKSMPEDAHECFGLESVSPQARQGWLLTMWLAVWWNRLLSRALWNTGYLGSKGDRCWFVWEGQLRGMDVRAKGSASPFWCGTQTELNTLGQEWQSPHTVKGTSLPFGSGEEENPPFSLLVVTVARQWYPMCSCLLKCSHTFLCKNPFCLIVGLMSRIWENPVKAWHTKVG